MRLHGSILIVVLGLLAVLAVVGIAFVTMSSIESSSAANFALQAQFDLAADGAIDYVTQALIRDVWEFGTWTGTGESSGSPVRYRNYTGWLLTGKYGTWPWDWPDPNKPAFPPPDLTKLPWPDWPDAFLATSWSSTTAPVAPNTPAYSFRTSYPITNTQMYNLTTWGGLAGNSPYTTTDGTKDSSPNNLGIPGGTGTTSATSVSWYSPPNGLWIPELACPYENGIIRVSVTVQDHAAMVNLNAHGTNSTWSPYGDTKGRGYFVCDLMPDTAVFTSTGMDKLLLNTGKPPGRWSATYNRPGNVRLGEIFIQNPAVPAVPNPNPTGDRPFSLDDEFELRRLTGTYAQSRLEQIAGSGTLLDSTPGTTTAQKVGARLGLTTVGWNAEVLPGQITTVGNPTAHKIDLNLATDQGGTSMLASKNFESGAVWIQTTYPIRTRQFCANILAFKERYKPTSTTANYYKTYTNYGAVYGARRQAILTKIMVTRTANKPSSGQDTLDVRVQLYNPWYGNYAGDETANGAIDVTGHVIKITMSAGNPVTYNLNALAEGNTRTIPFRTPWDTQVNAAKPIPSSAVPAGAYVTKITLEASGPGIIDQLLSPSSTPTAGTDLPAGAAAKIVKRRPIGVWDVPRALADNAASCMVTVLYVKKWQDGSDAQWNTIEGTYQEIKQGKGIPIRFPHSVPTYNSTDALNMWDPLVSGPLPPYYNPADTSGAGAKKGIFKAFLRVGDLDQVLCVSASEAAATSFWPWIYTVATQTSLMTGTSPSTDITYEQAVKWDWWPAGAESNVIDRTPPKVVYDSTNTNLSQTQFRRYNAANLFCVDSPWADSFDNDGDLLADYNKDTGRDAASGRVCGPEVRVAGRVNLNTATDQALKALGLSLFGNAATFTTDTTNCADIRKIRPLASPAEVLRPFVTGNKFSLETECMGPLEKRDLWYARISNIASTRSDTFSIYGTVQYVIPPDPLKFPASSQNISDMKIVRTRRFWALVDRSPSLSYRPANYNETSAFIRPRIMNFQWMD